MCGTGFASFNKYYVRRKLTEGASGTYLRYGGAHTCSRTRPTGGAPSAYALKSPRLNLHLPARATEPRLSSQVSLIRQS